MKNKFLSHMNPVPESCPVNIFESAESSRHNVRSSFSFKLLLSFKSILSLAVIPVSAAVLVLANGAVNTAMADPQAHSHSVQQVLPAKQAASCPDFELLAIPGTYDSYANDNPFHPHSSPDTVLNKIVNPLRAKYPQSRLEEYTVPYMAQLRSPETPHDASFEESHLQGQHRVEQRLKLVNARCPLTKFILVGFSQGAQIAGDVAAELGLHQQPINPQMVSYIALISDPRRVHGKSFDLAPAPAGDGIETTIKEMDAENPRIDPGTQLTKELGMAGIYHGARVHDFGTLDNRVSEICAPHDGICDSPMFNSHSALQEMRQDLSTTLPRHIGYGTPIYWSKDGKSAAQWIVAKISTLVNTTPPIPH